MLSNKEKFALFCEREYVPIFSQPWWMDAICGPDNWDVWICEWGDDVVAAMPYYLELRNGLRYITKAPLTQNNGIIFADVKGQSFVAEQKREEKIINGAFGFLANSGIDVYEQQFHYSLQNWSPFYWNGCDAIPRYTYVIDSTMDLDLVWSNASTKMRGKIKKGQRNTAEIKEVDPHEFYSAHERVFTRQGLECPFSRDLWLRLWSASVERNSGQALGAFTENGEMASLIFLVKDERSVYQLLGGSLPGYGHLDTYDSLIWHAVQLAHSCDLLYDFEGSMIKRIAKSFREFGGVPKQYFRIRKVFNPDVIMSEAEQKVARLGRA